MRSLAYTIATSGTVEVGKQQEFVLVDSDGAHAVVQREQGASVALRVPPREQSARQRPGWPANSSVGFRRHNLQRLRHPYEAA